MAEGWRDRGRGAQHGGSQSCRTTPSALPTKKLAQDSCQSRTEAHYFYTDSYGCVGVCCQAPCLVAQAGRLATHRQRPSHRPPVPSTRPTWRNLRMLEKTERPQSTDLTMEVKLCGARGRGERGGGSRDAAGKHRLVGLLHLSAKCSRAACMQAPEGRRQGGRRVGQGGPGDPMATASNVGPLTSTERAFPLTCHP